MSVATADARARFVELYAAMLEIRLFEEELLRLYRLHGLTGTTHTAIGQEAIAVGVLRHVRPGDGVVSNHRCHGHYLAAGGDPRKLLDEIRGDRAGVSRGVGGSQHVHFDRFFSNGILGGTLPLAGGLAFADKIHGNDALVVCFLGDGALGEGALYETLNLVALWDAPIVFVVENNGIAQSTPQHLSLAGSIAARFTAFGIAVTEVDGNDAPAVDDLARATLAHVRSTSHPACIIANTYRLEAHSKGDDFRDPAEIATARAFDPLARAQAALPTGEIARVRGEAEARIAAAFAGAADAPLPPEREIISADRVPPSVPSKFPWRTGRRDSLLTELQRVLEKAMEQRPEVHLLGEDILDPSGGAFRVTSGLSTRYPGRVWTTPISEAAITGFAGGMALSGLRPVVEIMFGDFSTLIVDQIVNHIAKFERMYGVRTPLIVRTPMGGRRGYGPTHSQSLEKLFLGVPGLYVVAADPIHDQDLIWGRMFDLDAPCLYVENKVLYSTKLPLIDDGMLGPFTLTANDGWFPTTRLSLGNSADAVIVTYGEMVLHAIDAARALFAESELTVDIVVPSALAPLDVDALAAAVGAAPLVVAEEGTARNGFGAEVIAALSECQALGARRVRRVAMADTIVPNSSVLERMLLPSSDDIVRAVRTVLR